MKLKHNIQWETSWRELGATNRYSAFRVREDSGHTLKSSIRQILSMDYRDSPIFPCSGTFLRFITEYAGVLGNVGFVKNEIHLQQNLELFSDTVSFC